MEHKVVRNIPRPSADTIKTLGDQGTATVHVEQVADMPAYHALAHRLFATQSNIRNVRSFFSILRSKFETQVELS